MLAAQMGCTLGHLANILAGRRAQGSPYLERLILALGLSEAQTATLTLLIAAASGLRPPLGRGPHPPTGSCASRGRRSSKHAPPRSPLLPAYTSAPWCRSATPRAMASPSPVPGRGPCRPRPLTKG